MADRVSTLESSAGTTDNVREKRPERERTERRLERGPRTSTEMRRGWRRGRHGGGGEEGGLGGVVGAGETFSLPTPSLSGLPHFLSVTPTLPGVFLWFVLWFALLVHPRRPWFAVPTPPRSSPPGSPQPPLVRPRRPVSFPTPTPSFGSLLSLSPTGVSPIPPPISVLNGH